MFLRREIDRVWSAAIGDNRVACQPQLARGCQQPHAFISEPIDVGSHGASAWDAQPIGCDQVADARRVNIEHQYHWRRIDTGVGQVEAQLNFHEGYSLWKRILY